MRELHVQEIRPIGTAGLPVDLASGTVRDKLAHDRDCRHDRDLSSHHYPCLPGGGLDECLPITTEYARVEYCGGLERAARPLDSNGWSYHRLSRPSMLFVSIVFKWP